MPDEARRELGFLAGNYEVRAEQSDNVETPQLSLGGSPFALHVLNGGRETEG